VGICTKELIRRLRPGEVAVIDHRDLDEVAAGSLVRRRVRAVVNAASSISGRYPCRGAEILLNAGIPLLDELGPRVLEAVADGDWVTVRGAELLYGGRVIARGRRLDLTVLAGVMTGAWHRLDGELGAFLENTLDHMAAEKDRFFSPLPLPRLRSRLFGRTVVIVARGSGYIEDLRAIGPFIREERPILIGVDGGADALLEQGFGPHIIVGDMDSVSDGALRSGAELVIHAYLDRRAPGRDRLDALNLHYEAFPAPGTSEDAAMLLAHGAGAALVVIVGGHFNIVDFLDKGRGGMASTLLTRLRVGPRLVDARGLSRLYRSRRIRPLELVPLAAGTLFALAVLAAMAPEARLLVRLLFIQVMVLVGRVL